MKTQLSTLEDVDIRNIWENEAADFTPWLGQSDNIDHIAEQHKIELLYLPPYSPDLNPIEKFWANFKRNLRKCIKKFISFEDAISHAFNQTISG